MRLYPSAALTLAALLLAGCGTNVLLGELADRPRTAPTLACDAGEVDLQDPRTVRVYIDRGGELYPSPFVPVSVSDARPAAQTLQNLYDLDPNAPEWATARAELGLDPDAPWAALQAALFDRASARIRGAVAADTSEGNTEGAPRPLVVLVHGYRTVDAECTYAEVRRALGAYGDGAAFLQVNWDGLAGNKVLIWKRAQFNFPQTGFALRRLLTGVDPSTPVRVITHSSGGPVAAHAFWDASASLPPDCGDVEAEFPGRALYHDRVCSGEGLAPPAFDDLRIGMVVPAMPSSAFREYDAEESRVARLVVGVNPYDVAVSRLAGRSALPICNVSGNTCLPVRRGYACGSDVDHLRGQGVDVRLYDFSGSERPRRNHDLWAEAHDWLIYLQRDDWEPLVRSVFEAEDPGQDETAAYCGG